MRVAASEVMLFLQPLEDPIGCVLLLHRPLLVIFQNRVDHAQPWTKLGPPDPLLSLIACGHRELQYLPYRL